MKKLLCILCFFAMIFGITACNSKNKDTVTIFVSDTVTIYGPDGTAQTTAQMEYEENWQNKASFTVTYSESDQIEIIHSSNNTILKATDTVQIETYYDDNGRVSKQVNHYLASSSLEKMETTFTYDSYGRQIEQTSKAYFEGQEQPNVQTKTYTYTDTDEGSKGVCQDGTTYTLVYDHNYRLIRQVVTSGDKEVSCIDSTYDEHGNTLSTATYAEGEKVTETCHTYKAVEVSKEFADRFPQFKREN